MIIQIATVMIVSFTLMYGILLLIKSTLIPINKFNSEPEGFEFTKKELTLQRTELKISIIMIILSLVVLYYMGMLSV